MSVITSGEAVVNAEGVATITLGPVPSWRLWTISTLTVSLSAGNGTARVYQGQSVDAGQLIEGTYSGDQDTTSRLDSLRPGEAVTVQWTAATPGAIARVMLRGRETEGPGA